MLYKNLLLSGICFLGIAMLNSCTKNDATPPADDWINQLDTSIDANERAQLKSWIQEGLSSSRMAATVGLYDDDSDFYNALNTAKSIYHQRLLINDRVDAIPGIAAGMFVSNGLPAKEVPATPAIAQLNLPATESPNFVDVKDTVLRGGAVMYRVIGGEGSYPTGGYWVLDRPKDYGEIIGGTAVQPQWNGFNVIVVYTLSAQDTMKVWKGPAAHQPIAGTDNKYYDSYMQQFHLGGDMEQIFVPVVYRDFQNEVVYNYFLSNITSQDSITWKKN